MGWRVYSASNDLCSALACPVAPGSDVELNSTQSLPGWAPRGAYAFRFEARAPAPAPSQQLRGSHEPLVAMRPADTGSQSEPSVLSGASEGTSDWMRDAGAGPSTGQRGLHGKPQGPLLMCVDVSFDVHAPMSA
uniref:MD-2-related lipid-recognition domain-containing protein n=1 Tax=Chlamydomonas leiostraca TaxID=1034604 RepID=A0A7S0S2J6_9CHLO